MIWWRLLSIITARVRSMTRGYVLTGVCLFNIVGGGTPSPSHNASNGGGTPVTGPRSLPRGTPSQVVGYPSLRWGYPNPKWGSPVPCREYPSPRQGGTPVPTVLHNLKLSPIVSNLSQFFHILHNLNIRISGKHLFINVVPWNMN